MTPVDLRIGVVLLSDAPGHHITCGHCSVPASTKLGEASTWGESNFSSAGSRLSLAMRYLDRSTGVAVSPRLNPSWNNDMSRLRNTLKVFGTYEWYICDKHECKQVTQVRGENNALAWATSACPVP